MRVRTGICQGSFSDQGRCAGPGAPLLTPAVAQRRGNFLVVFGDGRTVLPLVFVDDVVDACLLAAQRDVPAGSVFHIVDDAQRVSQNDLIRLWMQGVEGVRTLYVPMPCVTGAARVVDRVGTIVGRRPSIRYRLRSAAASLPCASTAAREQLGWSPRVGIAAGLARTVGGDRVDGGDGGEA